MGTVPGTDHQTWSLPLPSSQAGLACHGLLQLSRDPSLWPSLTLLGALADTQTVLVLVAR